MSPANANADFGSSSPLAFVSSLPDERILPSMLTDADMPPATVTPPASVAPASDADDRSSQTILDEGMNTAVAFVPDVVSSDVSCMDDSSVQDSVGSTVAYLEQQPATVTTKTRPAPYIQDASKSLYHKSELVRSDNTIADYSVPNPGVVGHRGALYDELENTREGFNYCARIGCDAVELDVFLLEDGSLIVFHGAGSDRNPGRLEEYCNEPGSILDMKTFEETQRLVYNPENPEFPCDKDKILAGKIPKLDDVLMDAKKTGLNLKIELKGPGTVKPTLELVEKYDMVDQCMFSSFYLPRLAELRELRPERNPATGKHIYRTGVLFDELPQDFLKQAMDIGADEVHLKYDDCTPGRIASIHSLGMGSMAWLSGPVSMTVVTNDIYLDVGNEDERCYDAILRTGVQQICVNKPGVAIGMKQNRLL